MKPSNYSTLRQHWLARNRQIKVKQWRCYENGKGVKKVEKKGTQIADENFAFRILHASVAIHFTWFVQFSFAFISGVVFFCYASSRLRLNYFQIKIPVTVLFSVGLISDTFCAVQYLQIVNVQQHIIVNEDEKQHKFIFNVYFVFLSIYTSNTVFLRLFVMRCFCHCTVRCVVKQCVLFFFNLKWNCKQFTHKQKLIKQLQLYCFSVLALDFSAHEGFRSLRWIFT